MQKHIIRTKKSDSVVSVDANKTLEVNLNRTSKLSSTIGLDETLDQYEQYVEESSRSHDFRLIFTVQQYASNVLFNTITEITKDEGSKDVSIYSGLSQHDFSRNRFVTGNDKPYRWEMVMNTEYSKPEVGLEYKPGYDIFTNHILRNKTFKIVNYLHQNYRGAEGVKKSETVLNGASYNINVYSGAKYVYNTIGDFMRYDDGTPITYYKRLRLPGSIETMTGDKRIKHLYDFENLLSYADSIDFNLIEDRGWFGFKNNNSIENESIKYRVGQNVTKAENNDSRVMNNRGGCEFVDMYPDRTLYSFSPKYNKFRDRLEYNWDTLITYPYKNFYGHDLVQDQELGFNGMKVMSAVKTKNSYSEDVILLRTYIKHHLKPGDFITIYAKDGKEYKDISGNKSGDLYTFIVRGIGDLSGDNQDYYFIISDMSWLESLGLSKSNISNNWTYLKTEGGSEYQEITDDEINEDYLNNFELRYRKVENKVECEYYFRLFRKLPNLKNARESLTYEMSYNKNETEYRDFLFGKNRKNSVEKDKEGNVLDFDKKVYKLAFARNIFNDQTSQITYTDTINTIGISDNLGRPLSEIYFTVIKRNEGYNEWYGIGDTKSNPSSENVEFSHCFGEVISGVEMFNNRYDSLKEKEKRARMGDISLVNMLRRKSNNSDTFTIFNTPEYGSLSDEKVTRIFDAKPIEYSINKYGTRLYNGYKRTDAESDNNLQNDMFLGDVIEFNRKTIDETRLEWVSHRFNTVQRELCDFDNERYRDFSFQEVTNDDYDIGEFKIANYNAEDSSDSKEELALFKWRCDDDRADDLWVWQRPEGYYYRPFYPITIGTHSGVNQGSHYLLRTTGVYNFFKHSQTMEIRTSNSHSLKVGDSLFLKDLENEEIEYNLKVVKVVNNYAVHVAVDFFDKRLKDVKIEDIEKIYNHADGTVNTYSDLPKSGVNDGAVYEVKEENRKYIWDGATWNNYNRILIYKRNTSIPYYAMEYDGSYFWRDTIKVGESTTSDLPEYTFSNGAFYIHSNINFYLRRQDPYNISGIQCNNCFPNDVIGNTKETSNYEYKDETFVLC